MTREEEIYNAMGDAEWKHIDGTKDIELFDMGFKEGAEWADAHPHWISVDEEPPPKKSEYDDLSVNVLATDGKKIYKSVYDYGFKEWFTREIWQLDNITHWMHLSPPPIITSSKKGGEE